MKVALQDGKALELAAPYARNSGEGALIGTIFGVAMATLANAERGIFAVQGCFELAKASGAITEGAKVYWDNTAKNVTTTSTSNTLIGAAIEAAASGDATVKVRLNGTVS
jgi:predicted RecA/RadA family phage recombinase